MVLLLGGFDELLADAVAKDLVERVFLAIGLHRVEVEVHLPERDIEGE